MYKVFIVDDEEFVIKSLIGSISWESLGFEVAGKATNGRVALEQIDSMQVDVVFSDVRMPGINGLELIKEIQRNNPNIIFIIVSGYPEFSYAQKALSYGALGYCLKPFDEPEINKLLLKAKGILDDRSRNSNDDLYSLAELIYNPDKQGILKAKLQAKGIICNSENGISILSVASKKYYEFIEFEHRISFLTGTQKYCIIVPSKCISGQILLNNLSQEQYQNIKGIGISEPVFSLDKIQEAIEEANLLSYQYFINGEKICRYDLKENFKKGDEFVKDIIENYFKRKFFYGTFQKEIERLSSENGINIKHAFTIYNFITHYNNSYEAQSQDTIYGFNELTKLFSDFKSMCRYLDKTSSTEIGTRMKEARTINFSQILNYIDSNFCEDITIQDISEKYYINPSYLSQLFRKELGITFTDYLVKKRMEFAKELMQDENIKTVDIYQKCGYNDYFYFIRCFKKYFGKSPGQYRNS